MSLSPMSPHDEIYRRLADRRPAISPRSLYRGRDNDYLILVGFIATLAAVFIVFLHYDFAGTRLVRPSAFAVFTTKRNEEDDGYVVTWAARRGAEGTPTVPEPQSRANVSLEARMRGSGNAGTLPKNRVRHNHSGLLQATASPPSGVPVSTTSPPTLMALVPPKAGRWRHRRFRCKPSSFSTAAAADDEDFQSVLIDSGCEAVQQQLTAWLDPSVHPCDDFYAHVCGRWTANHSATAAGGALVSPRTLQLRQMELRLMAELKRGTDDGSLRWLVRLWDACRKPQAEPRSKEVFDNILSEHGLLGFPFSSQSASEERNGDDLSSAAAKVLALSSIAAIVDVRIAKWHPKERKNSSAASASARPRWLVRIGAPEPLFRDFSRMSEAHDEWYLTAAQGIAGHRDMRGLFRVEQALVELAAHRRSAEDYVRTTVHRLVRAPHWNWTRFLGVVFRGISTFGRLTPVLVKGGSFQQQLAALISQFGPVHLLNYLAFRVLVRYSPFLERSQRFVRLAQLSAARQPGWNDGDAPDDVVDLRCLRLMTSAVPELMAFVYWNGARPRGRKRNRGEREMKLKRARGFREMTRHLVDWTLRTAPHEFLRALGRGRDRATGLLKQMGLLRQQLFLPDWLLKPRLRMRFAELAFADAEESPLASWRGLLAARQRNALLKLADRGFETFWEGPALRDTPWMHVDEEYVAIPPGAVDIRFDGPAFFIRHVPRLGFDLARLIAARLGRTAGQKHGATLRLRLDLLGDCLRRQQPSARPSSDAAAHEDVIDLLALRVALHVFRYQVARGSRRFQLRGDDPGADVTYGTDQLFFYEFAMNRCEAYDETYQQERTIHGLRSPAPTLVNGPLRNLRAFARAFNCSRSSHMSPKRVCKL